MKKSIRSIFCLVIVLTAIFTLVPIKAYAILKFVGNTLQNTGGDKLYGLQSFGKDLYWLDETTGEMLTDTSIIFSHIVFETGPDGKISRRNVQNPFTGEMMDTFGVPEKGYEDDPRVILVLWGLSRNGYPYKLYSDGVNNFSCGHFTQSAFNAIGYICSRSSSHYQAVACRQPDTMTNGGYSISSLTKDGELVYPKLIYSAYESEGTPGLEEVTLRVGDIIFYEYIKGGKNLFNEGASSQYPNGPYYDYMHAPENAQLYNDVKYIHHSSIYIGHGKIMESGQNNEYNGVHVCSLRNSSAEKQLRVKFIYRYINDDTVNEKASTFDDKKAENVRTEWVDANSVKVSWDSVIGAEGYFIYGSSDASSESLKGTVTGGTVTSFIDEDPSDTYRVRAYNVISSLDDKKLSPASDPVSLGPKPRCVTRAEFLVMLMRACEIKPDMDIHDNFDDAAYYTGYLAAAKRLGIATGVGNNLFASGRAITRQEMFTMVYRALKIMNKLPEKSGGKLLSDFSDAKDVQPWAKTALSCFVEAGIITGSSGKLNPAGALIIAEIEQVLYNLLNR